MVRIRKVVRYLLIGLVTIFITLSILAFLWDYPLHGYPPSSYFWLTNVSAVDSSDGDKIIATLRVLNGHQNKALSISDLKAHIRVNDEEIFYDGYSPPIKKVSIREWEPAAGGGYHLVGERIDSLTYYNITPFEIIKKAEGSADVLEDGDTFVINADKLFEKGDKVGVTIAEKSRIEEIGSEIVIYGGEFIIR